MKRILFFLGTIILWIILNGLAIRAQVATGGTYTLEKSLVASGGGQNLTGGAFALDGTIGQAAAGGYLQLPPFSVYSGFWSPAAPLAPTAAMVSIHGRARTASGRGILRVRISLVNASGEIRSTMTSDFGYYRFDNLPAGETYILTARGKRFTFSNPTQVVTLNEEVGDLDFVALN